MFRNKLTGCTSKYKEPTLEELKQQFGTYDLAMKCSNCGAEGQIVKVPKGCSVQEDVFYGHVPISRDRYIIEFKNIRFAIENCERCDCNNLQKSI